MIKTKGKTKDGIVKSISSYFVAVLFFIMINPSYVWGGEWPRKALIAFSGILLILSVKDRIKMPNPLLAFIVTILCCYQLTFENILSFTALLIIPFFFIPPALLIKTYHYIVRFYAAFMIISIIAYFLVTWLGINLPSHYIAAANQYKEFDYTQYPFLVIPNDFKHPEGLFRFHSVFDEPGVVGTIAAQFLMIERFKLNKWYNIVILLSGILSFSLFFYIISMMYYAVVFREYIFKLKNLLYLILVTIVLAIGYFSIKDTSDIDTVVEALVLSRFENEDGKLSGDKRSSDHFDQVYDNFLASGDGVLFGKGIGAHSKIDSGVQTYKMMVYDYGIVFVFLSLFFFLYYGYLCYRKKISIQFLLFAFFLFGFYYQRPAFLLSPAYFFLFLVIPVFNEEEKVESV